MSVNVKYLPFGLPGKRIVSMAAFFFIQFEFRFIPYAAFVNDYLVQFCFNILNIKSLFFVYLLINNMLFSVVRNVSQYCPF